MASAHVVEIEQAHDTVLPHHNAKVGKLAGCRSGEYCKRARTQIGVAEIEIEKVRWGIAIDRIAQSVATATRRKGQYGVAPVITSNVCVVVAVGRGDIHAIRTSVVHRA